MGLRYTGSNSAGAPPAATEHGEIDMFQIIGTLLAVATLMWVVVTKPAQVWQGCNASNASLCTASNTR